MMIYEVGKMGRVDYGGVRVRFDDTRQTQPLSGQRIRALA